jgi:hypothetical protein
MSQLSSVLPLDLIKRPSRSKKREKGLKNWILRMTASTKFVANIQPGTGLRNPEGQSLKIIGN